MKIEWRDVPAYDGFYQASNTGLIRRNSSQKILKITFRDSKPRCGYGFIMLHRDNIGKNFPVHQIIARCFLPEKPFDKAEINHIDANKKNNRFDNLEWLSHAENMRHAFKRNPAMRKSAKNFGDRTRVMNRKLSLEQVVEIRKLFGHLIDRKIAEQYRVARKTISCIRHGKTWQHI